MASFLIQKGNLILSTSVAVFIIGYIVFSSLATSLDFEMDRLLKRQTAVAEERDLFLADAVKARSRSALLAAKDSLGLVEVILAEGYIEISSQAASVAGGIAHKP